MRKVIQVLTLFSLSVSILFAQVANTAWPMKGHDLLHTGRSAYNGPSTVSPKWNITTGDVVISCPVICADGTILIGSCDKKLYALNPDGTQKWAFNVGGSIHATPTIAADGTIYVGSWENQKFHAINPDGTEKWSYSTGGGVSSSAAIGSDGTIYFGSYLDYKVNALKPDGTLKWSYAAGGFLSSSPVIGANGIIYIGCSDYKLHAIKADGTKSWEFQVGMDIVGDPSIAADGTIYFGSGDNNLYALNPDGTKKWEFATTGPLLGSPSIASDGTIYIGSIDKNIYAVNPDGTKKWEFVTKGGVMSTPAIGADGILYVGSGDGNLYALNPDGTQKWLFTTGKQVESSPAIGADGTLYVGSRDNKFYAFASNGNTTTPSLTVTSPKGGEQWQAGSVNPITWTSTGNPGNVNIELFKGGVLIRTIIANNANSGKINWVIPAAQASGTDYRVKISSVADATVTSQSAADFTISNGTVKSNDPWPIYHHDNQHTGRSAFNGPASPTVIWKYTDGPFLSSPVVKADGTIYVGNNYNGLLAIDATGNKKWSFKSNASVIASPSIGPDGTVYIGHQSVKFSAIKPDGTVKWELPVVAGANSAPAFADDGTIYIGATLVNFYALNPDGTTKWKIKGGTYYSAPVIATDGTVYFTTDDKLIAVTPAGVKKWEYSPGGKLYTASLASDGTIYTGSDNNKLYAVNPDGTKKWEFNSKDALPTCPAIALDGTIYISSLTTLYAVNKDGSKKWEFDIGTGRKDFWFSSPIIDAAGIIYVGSYDQNLYAINPDGTKKWAFPTGATIESDPIIAADGVLYIGTTGGSFYALGKAGNTTPNITVTAPNGGEQWQQGTTQNITWSSTGVTGNVKIELFKTGKVISTIANSVANSGTFSWNIPATQTIDTDYRVKISSIADATLAGQSVADFAITAGGTQTPAITVTSPNGGEQWQRGIAHTITWTSTGITGNVKIDLLKTSGTQSSVITASTANNGTYSWTIPITQNIGTDYRVKISSVANTTVTDNSNAEFSITNTTTTLGVPVQLSPINNAVNVNKPVTLAWQAVNTAVSYEYELYGPASATVAIETNTVTTTSAIIQYNLIVGTKYSWRVRAIDASDVHSAYSPLWSFTVSNQTTTQLDAPTLIAPVDAAIDVPINTVFSWTAVANAKAYDVDVATTSDFSKKVTLSTTNTTLTAVLANNTVYYWRARAKQGNIISAWSTANSFTTVAFIPTSGLDAAIGNSKVGSIMMGNGVINNTGNLQTVQLDQQVNRQSEFYITIKNTGNVPDSFLISSTSTIGSKWRVNVFDISGINRTLKVFTGGWSSYSVKPGESVKVMLRFAANSGQVIDETNPPTQSVTITAQSLKDLYSGSTTTASDTVVGTVVLVKKTGL